jgi:hypothetical protein
MVVECLLRKDVGTRNEGNTKACKQSLRLRGSRDQWLEVSTIMDLFEESLPQERSVTTRRIR